MRFLFYDSVISIEKGKSIDLFKENFLKGIKKLESEVVKKWKVEAGATAISIDVANSPT